MAAAFAILLSVIVRRIRAGASWQAVEEGRAQAEHLRELTGVMEYDALQKAFGPPRLEDGVFPVTRPEVLRQRTVIGYLLGDRWLDGASALIALAVLLPIWPLWGTRSWLEGLLMFAGGYQLAGWLASFRFFGRR
jgi:hypothetical protein